MIHQASGLYAITAKGKMFVGQYDQLTRLIESAGL
jgi:predicted transcriptional regulator